MAVAEKSDEQYFDEVYDNIARLYDHAENLLNSAYHEDVEDHEKFLAEIEPIIQQIENSANSIAEDFSTIIEKGELPTNAMKRRVNSSLRKILLAIQEYRASITD
ncbi:MAG: hypothetical protein COV36_04280 [Alphaproteobacteria bacterium CG11_big_fil_rev_8_21_14_0_20_44_7]|nr:MAG: hypothetical protein COV36_04280 [Alphaproteobacteria bacterium CG11_big_fil_rev_8_21_14_0_20_44_7]